MKRLLTLLVIALLLSSCQTNSYHCVSIHVTFRDTLNIKSDNSAISRYEGGKDTKVGDTILIWHNDTLGSNYVVKSIK